MNKDLIMHYSLQNLSTSEKQILWFVCSRNVKKSKNWLILKSDCGIDPYSKKLDRKAVQSLKNCVRQTPGIFENCLL